ncbi:MAG: hypothetical protein R3F13_16120 [Prosthecobacter sp.]
MITLNRLSTWGLWLCVACFSSSYHLSFAAYPEVLRDVVFTTPGVSIPLLRFQPEQVDILDSKDGVKSAYKVIEWVEPGLARRRMSAGEVQWWVFADDRVSGVYAYLKGEAEMAVEGDGPPSLPAADAETGLELKLSSFDQWKLLRVWENRVVAEGDSGTETFEAIPWYPNLLQVMLPKGECGFLILSKSGPKAWWSRGRSISPMIRRDVAGAFRRRLQSSIESFTGNSVQFPYLLLRHGRTAEAAAQERNALEMVRNNSRKKEKDEVSALRQFATQRRWNRDYETAAAWTEKAWRMAKEAGSIDAKERFAAGLDHAERLSDTGRFEEARTLLAVLAGEVAPFGETSGEAFSYHRAMGGVQFGLKDYAAAVATFRGNAERARKAKSPGTESFEMLNLLYCELGSGGGQSEAVIAEAVRLQDERQKENPRADYDTWKLALACAVMGRWEDALRFAPTRARKGYVTYEEYARMLTLVMKGDREEAQKFAGTLEGRFEDVFNVNVRTDVDEMFLKLMEAIARGTPAALAAAEAQWTKDVQNLKDRPLTNYILARAIVASLVKLRAGGG